MCVSVCTKCNRSDLSASFPRHIYAYRICFDGMPQSTVFNAAASHGRREDTTRFLALQHLGNVVNLNLSKTDTSAMNKYQH